MHEDIILFNSSHASYQPFRMIAAGTSYCDGSYHISRCNSPMYVFEYIEKGRGYLRVNNYNFEVKAGDVYIVPYGSSHEYGSSADDPWTKYWFNISGCLVGELLSVYKLNDIFLFKNYPLKDVFINGLKDLENNRTIASSEIGPKIVLDIVLKLAAHRDYLKEKVTISPMALKLKLFLDDRVFETPPTLAEMCEHIMLSPAQANRIFKRDFGETPYQYLLNRKINAAKELLITSVRHIKEIAFSLGFTDEYYFSNIFKRKTGSAPAIFRKESRK